MNPFQTQLDELTAKISANEQLLTDPDLKDLAEAEISDLKIQYDTLSKAAEAINTDKNQVVPTDVKKANCILEVRGGAGGDEAKIWAHELLRMYLRFAENNKLKITYLDDDVIKIKGTIDFLGQEYAPYHLLRFESGVHRVQRVPTTEAAGRIHTSTASVAVFPEVQTSAVNINPTDLEWQFCRAGGAGGQNVNKVNSAARLTHIPTGVVVNARQERSQAQNRQIALEILAARLWEIEEEKRQKELGNLRSAIGRAQRAEKIRTYNFPQNRITDHRLEESWYNLPVVLEGDLLAIISACQSLDQA